MSEQDFTNSTGMRMVRIEAGTFTMGNDRPLPAHLVRLPNRASGDFDERPEHTVHVSRPFHMAACHVTNAQFEEFDPSHRDWRGHLGFSEADDEAAVYVTWKEATAFCQWLSAREGRHYRLPTEAEWEYACRAGTMGPFFFGDDLPVSVKNNQAISWYPDPARGQKGTGARPLTVGQTPPNAWGLSDMHGNVEEWCADWYGPYSRDEVTDPLGPAEGDFRVTRGGSHSTELYYLRSANRAGTLPEERSWLIGFRVVAGELLSGTHAVQPKPQPWQINVRDVRPDIKTPDASKPYFRGPRIYVKLPEGSDGAMFEWHNHVPAIAACPNGDILAAWYTCREEPGREVATVASRLRAGDDEWDAASMFWDAPDRNDHASALWVDGNGRIYHIVGLSVAATWGNLATVLRTSDDNGVTWSPARFIIPDHGIRHMPIPSMFQMQDGTIVLPCDAVTVGKGGTALWMSNDKGRTWRDPGGTIAGIHAGVTQLTDGRLIAYGRGDEVDGMMPMSISSDAGKSWEVTAGPFPPVHTGQRLVLLRLREGPILFVAFANEGLKITDRSGAKRTIHGLYCAVSEDECRTWSNFRSVSDDADERLVETMDGFFRPMGRSRSELAGYCCATQSADGIIHLLSSRNHYEFNLAWLREKPPALDE